MCGIAGAIALASNGASYAEQVRAATTAMAHRGPAGDGYFQRDRVWLGHRYLPIIDPPHGWQPMHRADRLSTVFNGEIYNAAELRAELEARGCTFETRTDTEVLLAAFEVWGLDCLVKLRGMFAFAIADWQAQQLHLVRDPLGIKPLVYFEDADVFAFASEINALRCVPEVRRRDEIDLQALDDYLRLLYIPCPRTIYKSIRKLPPATALSIGLRSGETSHRRYWQLRYQPDESRTPEQWQEAVEAVLSESIRAHGIADVKVGALVSGGVDSTLIATEMARAGSAPLHTFTTGFSDESGRDERAHARRVSEALGTQHHEIVMPADITALLPQAARATGEPFGDSSILCAWEVCRFAKEHVGVVLSGDGGDEFFAGYPLYREWLRRLRWSSGPHPRWQRMLQPLLHWARPLRFPALIGDGTSEAELWTACVEHTAAAVRRQLWKPELWREAFAAPAHPAIAESFASRPGLKALSRAQASDIDVYLPGDILPKIDAASMAHGLEARTPFVDVRVAEFAATIPQSVLTTGDPGHASTWSGKEPLKKWVARKLPVEFVQRPKQGFTAPLAQWLTQDAATRDRVRASLESSSSPLRQWFDPEGLRLIAHSKQLHWRWQMLYLATWAEERDHV